MLFSTFLSYTCTGFGLAHPANKIINESVINFSFNTILLLLALLLLNLYHKFHLGILMLFLGYIPH